MSGRTLFRSKPITHPSADPSPHRGRRWLCEFHECRRKRGISGPLRHKSFLLEPVCLFLPINGDDLNQKLMLRESVEGICNEADRASLATIKPRRTRLASISFRFAALPDFALLIGIFDIALRRDLRHGREKHRLVEVSIAITT